MVNTLYGGTKTEMERLIADANAYAKANGMAADLSIKSFSDIVTAIELIQEKQGIAGTTAKEAATTIEGAFNSTKAAWSNLVAGLANPDADLDQLMDNLIVALVGDKEGTGLLNNLMPAIQRALEGIGTLVSKAAPVISKNLPALFGSLLPSVISAATSLVVSLAKALPGIARVIVAQVPMIAGMLLGALRDMGGEFVTMGGDLMKSILDGINKKYPELGAALTSLRDTFSTIVDGMKQFWDEHGSEILTKAGEIFNGIKDFVITALTFVTEFINGFIQGALALWDEFGTGIMGYLTAVKDFWIAVFEAIAQDVTTFIENLKTFWATWGDEIMSVTQTVWNAVSTVINTVLQIITGLVQVFTSLVKGDWSGALEGIRSITSTVFNAIKTLISKVLSVIQSVILSIWNGIKSKVSGILNSIRTTISNVFNSIRTTVSSIMTNVRTAISTAWNAAKTTVSNVVDGIKTKIKSGFDAAKTTVSNIFGSIKDKIKEKMDAAKEAVSSVIEKIKSKFKFKWSLPKLKLPHIKIEGKFSINPPSVPHFSIDWYRKAMDNAFLLDGATIFGAAGGNLLGGGEAGKEIVYGHDNLMKDIRNASGADVNARILSMLEQIYDLLEKGQTISIGKRDFARLVNEVS